VRSFKSKVNGMPNKLLKVKFGLNLKIALAVILTIIISSPISQFINMQLMRFNFFSGTLTTYTTSLVNLLVTVCVMLFFCRRFILRHVKELLAKIDEIASQEGDLTQRIEIHTGDELEALGKATNHLIDSMTVIITEIRNNSDQLASHSREMASSSEEVSAAVEEVASTTGELATTSDQGAENAGAVARKSEQVQQVAEDGNNAVKETVEKINSISYSSQTVATAIKKLGEQSSHIGEISNTITNIADQTNLLALNAAIEAARAGEHGRGFAVVAEEVRKLAEQAAEAAGNITGLIGKIQVGVHEAVTAMDSGVAEVEEGVQVAEKARSALNQIIRAVERNTELIKDVAAGVERVNDGSQQLSASGQQITSTVQQLSSTAQEIAGIADTLHNTVARFKIET